MRDDWTNLEREIAAQVTDLETARHYIITLRRAIRDIQTGEPSPIRGEYTAFLDDGYASQLRRLYYSHYLIGDPKDEYWLDPPDMEEAFTDFVKGAIDLAWDMMRDEQERDDGNITPSA